MSEYKIKKQYMQDILVGEIIIRTNQDGSITSFLKDEANTDYQAYLAWVAEGNTAEEWTNE